MINYSDIQQYPNILYYLSTLYSIILYSLVTSYYVYNITIFKHTTAKTVKQLIIKTEAINHSLQICDLLTRVIIPRHV